jgi:hypothetical protein
LNDEDKMMSHRRTFLFVHFCIGIAGFYVSGAVAAGTKVDVCHVPPGNPDNAHTITISENAVSAHLDHGDRIGACESDKAAAVSESATQSESTSEQTAEVHESESASPSPTRTEAESACACPRPGVWRVTNLDGYMECNVLGIKRKLKGAGKNDGAIWIISDDCSTTFLEAYEKEREDVIMDRGRACLYFGIAPGEEDGVEVIFDGAYKLENEEFISGEFHMEMAAGGMDCTGYRPFEIEFVEPLSEKKYAKLEKKMQAALEAAEVEREEHREQIDKYLERTDGGKAFGGRNNPE